MAERRRLTGTCIGTVAISLVVAGGVLAGGAAEAAHTGTPPPVPAARPDPGTPPDPGATPGSHAAADPGATAGPGPGPAPAPAEKPPPAIGAYLDYGPDGVKRMAELSKWLGGADLTVGHTYLPGDRWENIEGRAGFLRSWADWRRGAEDRMFVLNVPMLEGNEERVSDDEVRDLLQEGAAGRFDRHYRKLAKRLVDLGVPDTVIVLGWEMNGTTYAHRCAPDPEAWKRYWNRIVTAMRAVPGQKFRFDFAPNRGIDAIPWTECYPGDDVVDIIGMDSYDQPPGDTFDQQVSDPYGLQAQVDFAAEHNKAISYPEWGLFRNGDNPEYMERMLDWMARHKPLYQTITDYCPHGVWQCDENPRSSEVFRSKLFGWQSSPVPGTPPSAPPVPSPPQTPAPSPSAPPETTPADPTPTEPPGTPGSEKWCVPVKMGEWINKWVRDFTVCVKPRFPEHWNP
ncbi:glycosyl hydrolase family 26 [Streptomyces agglomeratus]|uniref:Glycosyl hydrolase family 26 n=1 Tax=Streptomyces agglomeratus TaxID=285458 RepID=A0A1E5P722_9ACTN|nr:glycosyl hydrolase [Streptomyces agglomeratus]OEJ25343.1 glycosyl hydrolase family 26 [Streptomyces agglomeratus]OEJ40621.1 glycosyl hydrolase family 26 [Streptomyces agglomeratus]OEJ44998.1 glycosyl hydrolase family 26 [Streptomyces agglomeratus]OEJ53168.1 glycosyl hydrolase family 26 [Streptomyces agglomeratus]OEJ60505.1 glycosyl hydrolase family 26 [Streptomyces agglomeratus]